MYICSGQATVRWLAVLLLALSASGCGSFVACRMAQAPNTYPNWLTPKVRVQLAFGGFSLTNFPAHFAEVGPPPARLSYRVIEPADYALRMTATNWLERGQRQFQFNYRANVPGETNRWTASPRGTVVLLHGYGVSDFAMAPWALRLAENGWRCVLVDLRGHGQSSGGRIFFGVRETQDMRQLLDCLATRNELAPPVAAIGESYGAMLALRWQATDPRLDRTVAIAPFGVLSNAVLNIRREYAPWFPKILIQSGVKRLPAVLDVAPAELNPATALPEHGVTALFVAGADDRITPVEDVRALFELAAAESRFITVPHATHESVPYCFTELVPPVLAWLSTNAPSAGASGDGVR